MRARSLRKDISLKTLAFHGRTGIIRPPPARCCCVVSIAGTSTVVRKVRMSDRFEIVADGDAPNSLFKQILELEQFAVCFLHSLLPLFLPTRELPSRSSVTCRTFISIQNMSKSPSSKYATGQTSGTITRRKLGDFFQ
jgi:hypothetical protein